MNGENVPKKKTKRDDIAGNRLGKIAGVLAECHAVSRVDFIDWGIDGYGPPDMVSTLAKIHKLSAPPRNPGFGAKKGSSFERRVGKILGEWWRGKAFRKTPSSGGWDKLAADGDTLAMGDICVPADCDFPFYVECKKDEVWRLEEFINPTKKIPPRIATWWVKAKEEAEEAKKAPILVISRNNMGFEMVVCTYSSLSSRVNQNGDLHEGRALKFTVSWQVPGTEHDDDDDDQMSISYLYLMSLDTFMEYSLWQPSAEKKVPE